MSRRTRYIIYANGVLPETGAEGLKPDDFIIGVDGAAAWLLDRKITPSVAIGDFDSVSGDGMKRITAAVGSVLRYPQEKDYTDLELAVRYAVAADPAEIIIWGGFGTRADHTLSAVTTLEIPLRRGIPASMRDDRNILMLADGYLTIADDPVYRYLSVIPYTRRISVTLSGVKYPVRRRTMMRGLSVGVSNEITARQARITVHSGKAVIIRSRD
ncbi:thiamine diphosphokinase [Candidatus Gottesmanbacteria bacterium RBG_16_52_11]|uniref:Thiamine diphosphokinase n=1 Tax=Candidatus Gottesmanbacteria bacterium RBG_16_52_11 TaxID=1798374 RepID=A0A1F5YN41_9BACT|nr:MAG: thiamine diphosphokinase [Candidatus Gottesmanbacteria bacterium RBG_16_52_11]